MLAAVKRAPGPQPRQPATDKEGRESKPHPISQVEVLGAEVMAPRLSPEGWTPVLGRGGISTALVAQHEDSVVAVAETICYNSATPSFAGSSTAGLPDSAQPCRDKGPQAVPSRSRLLPAGGLCQSTQSPDSS